MSNCLLRPLDEPADADVPSSLATLVDLLRRRALQQTDQQAYRFLLDGENDAVQVTYGELDRRARVIGAQLQRAGAVGERALLLYPPGLEYIAAFFGCLYAGVTAVPAYPPNPSKVQRMLPRLQTIVRDARPAVALTTSEILPVADALASVAPEFQQLRWLASDTLDADLAAAWQAPAIAGATLAMLQYTSGSTAAPKGVMLSHGNLLHNLALIYGCFGHSPRSSGVIWLPPYHDMGLIGGILQPLYGAFPVTLMAPVAFLQRPLRWLQAISRYGATTSGGPNFAYDLCIQKITPEQRAQLDLSTWSVAFNGAEPIRVETMDRFAETFAACGFRREAFLSCYGLAEATLIVTGKPHTEQPVDRLFQAAALEQNRVTLASEGEAGGRRLAGCGPAQGDVTVAIARPETRSCCASDEIGEIWVASPSVAQGYWDRPDESRETFGARLADDTGPFLRTGDLGFLHDGQLFVTGRLKDLLIIRGRNHYPQDIELTVERSHPALRPGSGAAFSVEVDGEERLVIAQEVERQHRGADVAELSATIRRAVAEQHDLSIYAVVLLRTASLAKTSSGKIQRRACRAEFLAGTLQVIGSSVFEQDLTADELPQPTRAELLAAAPETRGSLLESYIQVAIARVLHVAPASIDVTQPVTSLGLDSLMAVELQHRLEVDLAITVSMTSFLEGSSVAQLAAEALQQLGGAAAAQRAAVIATQSTEEEHPLSYGQRALWFLHQLAPDSAAYNVAAAVRITSTLDVPALERAFEQLVRRHPALRTTFAVRDGAPVQRVQPAAELLFSADDAAIWTDSELSERLRAAAHQPFDLRHGPLLRVHLFTRSAEQHVLLLVVHHIVSDLWSLAVLLRELGQIYPAERSGTPVALDPLPIDYTDYARWQHAQLSGAQGERDWAYWQQALGGELPMLNLPADHPRPPTQTDHGASLGFQLSPELTHALKTLGQQQQTTLYMVLLAAFQSLLYRYTGQDDIIVGSPTAGRSQAELAGLVGYFVNPIPVRSRLSAELTFQALLQHVRATVLAAFEHAHYPLPLLIERLQPARDLSRSPLFQAMFILQKAPVVGEPGLEALALGAHGARHELGGMQLESLSLEQRVAQFDLTLTMGEADGCLTGTWEYNTDLFEPSTVARWIGHFEQLLAGVVADPRLSIAALPLLTKAEQQQLAAWNDTRTPDAAVTSLAALFERQVAQTPDAIAVLLPPAETDDAAPRSLRYAELNERANQLARFLRQAGVGPESCVGLCLDRSLELVVAILGVLKAGAAYLPLDPSYPPERLALLLAESRATCLLTEQALLATIGQAASAMPQVICLDRHWPAIAGESSANLAAVGSPENLACVIYTSGSTGQPKGVLLEQRNLINLVLAFIESYAPDTRDRILPLTAIASASFVGEVLPILCSGGALVLPDKGEFLDFGKLIGLIASQEITILSTVPSLLAGINALAERLPRLRLMLSGGEALFASQVDRLLDSATVVNGYGLTETAVCSTYIRLQPADLQSAAPIPIGRPVRNTALYVLDASMQPVPVGVPGQLYIGGAGLARGYLNAPAQTAARFVPDPWSDTPGARLYHTGDLARWLPHGVLEYLGRSDQQVKIRGFRIELGEIETRLGQHPNVQDVVVLARAAEHQSGPGAATSPDLRLVAYIVLRVADASTAADLRGWLAERVPDYMLPSAFVFLEALPLTTNGKVDIRALPLPDSARPTLSAAYSAPQTELERTIVAVWQEVLGLEKVGVHDNFFELGGHSLLLVKAHSKLGAAFDRPLSLVDLFKYPTISSLAHYLNQAHDVAPALDGIKAVADKQRQARSRRQQHMRGVVRRGENTDE